MSVRNTENESRKSGANSMRKSKGPGGSMKKNALSSQMIEREGSLVGLWNPYDSSLKYPYQVQANSMSTMLNLSRSHIGTIMNTYTSDKDKIGEVLAREKKKTTDALKLDRLTKADKASDDAEPEETVTLAELNGSLAGLEDVGLKVLSDFGAMGKHAPLLSKAFTALGGDADAMDKKEEDAGERKLSVNERLSRRKVTQFGRQLDAKLQIAQEQTAGMGSDTISMVM